MKAKTWTIIILLFLAAVLLFQNMEVVTLKVFFWKVSMSRIIAFPLLVLLGIFIGFFIGKYARVGERVRKEKTHF